MKFWKKKPQHQHREILIPAEHQMQIMELIRDHDRAPNGARSWEHYLLWKGIAEVIPEVKIGSWRISVGDPLNLRVIENA